MGGALGLFSEPCETGVSPGASRDGLAAIRKTNDAPARMHGTPVYFWKNGKVVAEKP
jgi:hypothetical protein